VYLYSAHFCSKHKALRHGSHSYVQLHQCLPLPRKRLPDAASPDCRGCAHLIAAYLLLTYLPRKDERLSRPGWLTYIGRFTHISGHPSPSAAGRRQNRESWPVKDQRSTTLPRNQLQRLPKSDRQTDRIAIDIRSDRYFICQK